MNASYITKSERTARQKPAILRIILSVFVATFIALSGTLVAFSKDDKSAEAFDATQWAMCYFGDDSIPGTIYQYSQSSDLQFGLRSKSSITGGVDDVETGLNWILDLFGPGFKNVNEAITGYSLEPFDPEKVEGESVDSKENFNKGAKVNPFDRFGVAGLKFTAYTGEWKHVVINACDTGAAAQDPKAGVFYEGRLEARSTWEDIDNSKDIRTMQFGKGFGTQFGISMADLVANGIFLVTKGIIVITIGLINFAFTDIVEVMGLNEMLAGGNGGIFNVLFNGIFTPLIVIIFALTGFNILFKGLIQRQYRSSMTDLLRALALFIIAIIIAASPMTYITLPNKVAVIGQSIILTTMNSSLAGGGGLCSTDIGRFETKLVNDPNADEQDILTQASESMRSAIGCQLWQVFLLKPWVQGQFGTDWETLYAKGKIAEWAPNNISADIQNENESMVGDAAVPMGDGSFIHNWALFQISTQTNAHAPIAHEGEKSKYTAGVANDWWRIVDALSNYAEEEVTADATGSGAYGSTGSVTYTAPKNTVESPYWDTWAGNTAYNRMWTASSSVIVAGIGVIAPLFFAFLTAVYSLGIAFLMAFAPIAFLLGCWSGKGWEIFKGWGELVINATLKRIVTGGMLAIAIGLEVAAIQMMDSLGWWQGILMLILVSVILIKSRGKIIDSLASVKISSTNFSATSNKMNNAATGAMKAAGKVVRSSAVAGVASKRYGGTLRDGVAAGAKDELKNMAYRSKPLMGAMTQYEDEQTNQGKRNRGQQACYHCGKKMVTDDDKLGTGMGIEYRDSNGNIMCQECYRDGLDPDAREFVVNRKRQEKIAEEREATRLQGNQEKSVLDKQRDELRKRRYSKSAFNNEIANGKIKKIIENTDKNGIELTPEQSTEVLKDLLGSVRFDIENHKAEKGMPAVPTEIMGSIDSDLLSAAWKSGNYEWIQNAYAAAWAAWFVETTGNAITCSIADLVDSMKKQEENR